VELIRLPNRFLKAGVFERRLT